MILFGVGCWAIHVWVKRAVMDEVTPHKMIIKWICCKPSAEGSVLCQVVMRLPFPFVSSFSMSFQTSAIVCGLVSGIFLELLLTVLPMGLMP